MGLVDDLKLKLTINKNRLDDELVENPMLLFDVADAYISAVDQRDACKNDLAVAEADADKRIRHDAEVSGDKITEGQVKALILSDKKRKAAYTAYADAKYESDRLGALKESFVTRGFALRDLCQLYVSNYFQENSVRSDAATDKIEYRRNRRKLAEARAGSYSELRTTR